MTEPLTHCMAEEHPCHAHSSFVLQPRLTLVSAEGIYVGESLLEHCSPHH